MTDPLSADVAVIGSGPGGAVTATVCAEAGKAVLLIEEGPDLPIDSAPHFSREEIFQKYRNAGITPALGKAPIAYVEGRCVGGGSEINRGLYHRTPSYVLDEWRTRYGVEQLSPDELAPHFAACEAVAAVEMLPGPASPLSARLGEGARALGWDAIEAPRLYRYADGRKQSMSQTFIPRFRAAGGRLVTNTRVRRIAYSSGKWRISSDHAQFTADALFLACGAVQTPALLRRSGFRRNVGDTLRFHPMLKMVALFREDVNRHGDLDPVHQVKQFEPGFGMGCSITTPPLLALALAGHREWLQRIASDWRRMGLYYVQNGGGYGKVRNLPGFRDPLVTVRHHAADLSALHDGLKHLAYALFAAGAIAVQPCLHGYLTLHSPDDIARLPETLAPAAANMSSVHIFASCPMGENRALCAADSWGRVFGAERLWISDASLFCGPTIANPQGTVMAIAHRNAVRALADGFR